MTVLTGDAVAQFRLVVLKSALRLESKGMRHSSGNRASVEVRRILSEAGIKPARTLDALLSQYEKWLAG